MFVFLAFRSLKVSTEFTATSTDFTGSRCSVYTTVSQSCSLCNAVIKSPPTTVLFEH